MSYKPVEPVLKSTCDESLDDSFSILGDCTVESGNYLFGLQGIISKRFQIVPGGTASHLTEMLRIHN